MYEFIFCKVIKWFISYMYLVLLVYIYMLCLMYVYLRYVLNIYCICVICIFFKIKLLFDYLYYKFVS